MAEKSIAQEPLKTPAPGLSTSDSAPATRQMYLIILAAGLGWLLDSIVINIYTVSLPQLTRDFSLSAQAIGFISSLFLLGYALGTIGGGTIADYLGRRISLGLSIGCYTIFSALTGAATTVGLFAAARFLTGIGAGTELPVGSAYVAEVAPQKWRGLAITVMNSVYSFGIFCASVIVGLTPSWRWAFGSTLLLGIIVYLIRMSAEESPRFRRIQTALANRTMRRDRFTIAEVFAPAYRNTTLRILLLWIGYWTFWWSWVIFVPRYLISEMHIGHAQIASYMGAFGLGGFICLILSGYVGDIIGRRWSITLFTSVGIIALWIWITNPLSSAAPIMGGLSFAFLLSPVPVMLVHTAETFPTTLRGTGQSVTIGIARLISVAGPAVAGALVERVGLTTEFRIVSALLLLTILAAWLGPETRGIPLVDGIADTPLSAGRLNG